MYFETAYVMHVSVREVFSFTNILVVSCSCKLVGWRLSPWLPPKLLQYLILSSISYTHTRESSTSDQTVWKSPLLLPRKHTCILQCYVQYMTLCTKQLPFGISMVFGSNAFITETWMLSRGIVHTALGSPT